jgi:dCTP diphosphatase
MPGDLARVSPIREKPAFDSLDAITDALRQFREERRWDGYHTTKNLAISIAIEVGELLEHFQWRSEDEIDDHLREARPEVAAELADVAIYVVQLAEVAGVSLAAAIETKIAENGERYPALRTNGMSASPYRAPRTGDPQRS